ncbi:MAG: polysaccharide deacetylase family protein [Solirubrobacterales bacterium]
MAEDGNRGGRQPSDAEIHRKRRLIAALVSGGAIALAIVLLAVTAGSAGTWDPKALEDGARTELPKLKLEAQAREAERQIAMRKAEQAAEDRAIQGIVQQNPVMTRGGSARKEVALTFDDGPSQYTDQVLDILKRYKAKGTFFILGNQINSFPLQLQRTLAEGHALGNHSWNHADFTTLSTGDLRAQLDEVNGTLAAKGAPKINLFRPPYGAYDPKVAAEVSKKGMLTVLWDIDTNDYKQPAPAQMAADAVNQAQNGSVILMHDGGGPRENTVAALPLIIKGLRKKGFEMVTLPQLLLDNPPSPDDQVEVQRTPVA